MVLLLNDILLIDKVINLVYICSIVGDVIGLDALDDGELELYLLCECLLVPGLGAPEGDHFLDEGSIVLLDPEIALINLLLHLGLVGLDVSSGLLGGSGGLLADHIGGVKLGVVNLAGVHFN
jgi:hypothetical protein